MDIATGAIGNILSKLADLLKAEYMLQTGVKDQINSLTKELESAQTTLQEIDQVHPDQLSNIDKIWARDVRDASYDMEDILDTFLVRVEGPSEPINKKRKLLEMLPDKVGGFFELFERLQEKVGGFFGKTVARHDIARAIDNIKKRLQEATERRGRYNNIVTRPSPSSVVDPRLAVMYKQVTQLIGIDKSRDELECLLSSQLGNEMLDKKLKIVYVVGVGGLGKTTLAKAVYEDMKGQFSCCSFVPIGRNPDLKKILRDILIELNKDEYMDPKFTVLDERQLIDELRAVLQGERYFIVIDDVWDIKSWESINTSAMVENNNGSRIIVTTRNSEVATGDAYHQYKLRPLSDENSKRLFYARIFSGEDKYPENEQQKVPKVAEKILKKCGGVPLAIITMASYLVGKSMEEWLEVCNSIGFCGKDKKQTSDTEWILTLSYNDLPSHLKTCLLYLSIFPEDHLISKHALIWMWIAEGFVNGGKLGDGLFEVGEGYFNELTNRSLIQPVEEENMVVKACRVHDMILDLIRSLSHEENFATVSKEISKGINARRFVLQNRVVEDTPEDNSMNTKRARSFITFRCRFSPRVNLRCFKLLRMLYLEDCKDAQLDEHVGNLHHLRCLGIRGDYDSYELPKEIGCLKFLRVLYLDHRRIGGLLPLSVGMLTQLVCLYAPGINLPSCAIKDLMALQELQICCVEGDDMSKDLFLKDLCNLSELRVLVLNCGNMDMRMESDLLISVGNLYPQPHFVYDGWLSSFIIDPSQFPRLSHLSLNMDSLRNKDLEIMGGLPELSYLYLCTYKSATLTGTTDRGYFKKLRSCLLPNSTVHFVVNEDSSVSFTFWYKGDDAPAFPFKRVKQDKCRVARAVMPNLEALLFAVNVLELTACNNGSCHNLGLEYLASLQKVTVHHHDFWLNPNSDADELIERQKAALRRTIQALPNRPTLQFIDLW
ncbi:hypothetical protein BS78_K341300 [Paspalum vaginatum]|uniref:AAA+ ATPase domain-containing protein n=1 Tax=Paspalum vaginatum TaxID=158149 RepID=A0A9W8CG85_9POAL|nr:hypothetical protein BS78_K341300 [Paspalum vaginatum]